MQSQKAVSVYFTSEQILSFGFTCEQILSLALHSGSPAGGRGTLVQCDYLYLYLYVTWQYALLCYRATGAIAPHCGFSGVSPDGNCAYVL